MAFHFSCGVNLFCGSDAYASLYRRGGMNDGFFGASVVELKSSDTLAAVLPAVAASDVVFWRFDES